MKKVFVSNETTMILESLKNISTDHKLYKTFYEKEVGDDWHVNVYGNAKIYGKALVYGNTQVFGNAKVFDNSLIYGNAKVYDLAVVSGNARVYGNAEVFGNAEVYGNAWIYGSAKVYDRVAVGGNAEIFGKAQVYANAIVRGDAKVTKDIVNIIGLPYNITLTDNHIQRRKKMSKETILKQIDELNKQLQELESIEKSNNFIKLLRDVLLNDKCTIILQGHEEWQFQEKYLMKDIKFEHRKAIAKSLQEIIKEINNDK